ncbi:MAG: PAS domain S-box protein [Planctomycetaceae bacterium]|nr:PAS domain S-box protein [Planctomycetaceae bacterium]
MDELRPLSILIVEDDVETCRNLQDILELDRHAVRYVTRAADLEDPSILSDVDVILLDWSLPDAVAVDLIPTLRQRYAEIEIVIVTGHGDFEMAVSALRTGAADYLLKPINPQALQVSLQRIADRQRLAREKAHSETMFRTLVEAAPSFIVIVRDDFRIEYVNPFAVELSGYRFDELLGRDFAELFLSERATVEAQENIRRMQLGESIRGYENQIRRKDGTLRWMVWNARRLDEFQGQSAILGIAQDVTDYREATEKLVQSERLAAIGEAMTGLAHESRNALQRSQAFLELLSVELEGQDEPLRLTRLIQEAQRNLHQQYEEVREYAAPLRVEKQLASLAGIAHIAWKQLPHLTAEKGAELRVENGSQLVTCEVDAFLIQQVFRNIFENSLAACDPPVLISFHSQQESQKQPRFVQVSIRDNGPGLTAEQKLRIFQPFYTTKMRGTGLGMTICKRIIEAHQGTISIGPGPGTEIVLKLPSTVGYKMDGENPSN